jgi:hypothetical protein
MPPACSPGANEARDRPDVRMLIVHLQRLSNTKRPIGFRTWGHLFEQAGVSKTRVVHTSTGAPSLSVTGELTTHPPMRVKAAFEAVGDGFVLTDLDVE